MGYYQLDVISLSVSIESVLLKRFELFHTYQINNIPSKNTFIERYMII